MGLIAMTDIETLVCEMHDVRQVLEYQLDKQNNLLSALVATTQRIAIALEDKK